MAKFEEVTPPAKSLIIGLRNMGYNFSTALADIIDNSISAGAKNISVECDPHATSPYVFVFDDGCGMGYNELKNAMTIGSDRSDKEDSLEELGRFGLGLKTASFSQCLKLTVASKNCGRINAMQYDIDEIKDQNKWILFILDQEQLNNIPGIDNLKQVKSGTLVVWEKFDTIEDQSSPDKFVNSMNSAIDEAKKHISFVFHRFYDDVNISVNKHRIDKRDPFLKDSKKTQYCRPTHIPVGDTEIIVTPYVLPNSDSLNAEERRLLGDTKNVSRDQGFYLYRNKRLIISGTWLRMNERNEFNKLARVQVDIPSSLDDVWRIDVKKSSARIPDFLVEKIKMAINDVVRTSKTTVTYRGRKESMANSPVWDRQIRPDGAIKYHLNKNHPIYEKLYESLDPEQRDLLDLYTTKVEDYIPIGLINNDMNDSTLKVVRDEHDANLLSEADELVDLINKYFNGSIEILDRLLDGECYNHLKDYRAEMVEKLRDDKTRS